MAHTADYDRWNGPNNARGQGQPPYSRCFTDAPWHPFRIVLIVLGFMEPFTRELPMEYAVELNRLIELQMEGSIG